MKYIRLRYFLVGITVVILVSCASRDLDDLNENEEPCVGTVSYANDVSPIVTTKCAIDNCHNGSLGADRNWTVYQNLHDKRQNVKTKVVNREMPPASSPAGALTDAQIQVISCWVDQGAQNN